MVSEYELNGVDCDPPEPDRLPPPSIVRDVQLDERNELRKWLAAVVYKLGGSVTIKDEPLRLPLNIQRVDGKIILRVES